MNLSEALEIVSRLIGCYPNGGANASDGYIGGLAAVLCDYPRMVAMDAAHPIKGVARACKFLPTIADLVGWCETQTKEFRRPLDVNDHYAGLRDQARRRREDEERLHQKRLERPTYDDLKSQHGSNWGFVETELDKIAKAARVELMTRTNRTIFERECAAAGRDANGLVSPALIAKLAEQAAADESEDRQ